MIRRVSNEEVHRSKRESAHPVYTYQWFEVDQEIANSLDINDSFQGGTVLEMTFGGKNPIRHFVLIVEITTE